MSNTSFTMMGFTQPFSALPIIKDVQNNAKGFTSRILWYFPQPIFAKLRDTVLSKKEMEMANAFEEFFVDFLSELYIAGEDSFLLKDENKIKVVHVQRRKFRLTNDAFDAYCDIHDTWEMNVCKENPYNALLGGLYSRGKGQVLRLSVPIHILTSVVSNVLLDVESASDTLHKDDESAHSSTQQSDYEDSQHNRHRDEAEQSTSHQVNDGGDNNEGNNLAAIPHSRNQQPHDSQHYDSNSDDEFSDSDMPVLKNITFKGYNIPAQISANAILIAHSLVESSIQQICILHDSHPATNSNWHESENESQQPEVTVAMTPTKIQRNTSKSIIKSILCSPGKVISLSRLTQKGLFRNKEIDGERGKNLVFKLVNEIEENNLASVERYTVANKSNVIFIIKHDKPEHDDDLQTFLTLIHSYGIGISTYLEKLTPNNDLDIQESEKHLQDYEVRKSSNYTTPNKRPRIQ